MSTDALMHWRTLGLPKRGCSVEEYEDAAAGDPVRGRFAMADGASESSVAGLWAQLLVGWFVHSETKTTLRPGWWMAVQPRWSAAVDGRPLPWFAEAKRQVGAFATFLGLVVQRPADSSTGRWRALAVGDSCLFQVRDDQIIKAFPLARSDEFGNQPNLIGSRPSVGNMIVDVQKRQAGRWQTGDRFLLMTDALAQWFLKQCEAGGRPWQYLVTAEASTFPAQIDELRDRYGLRNDDVALGIVDL